MFVHWYEFIELIISDEKTCILTKCMNVYFGMTK